jgi:MerR family transcriptional regulator, Zn(II)-responsive regulator of zntA
LRERKIGAKLLIYNNYYTEFSQNCKERYLRTYRKIAGFRKIDLHKICICYYLKMTNSCYRLYSKSDVLRISFILSAKEVGFTLNEVHQLLELEVTKDKKSCQDVKEFVDNKIQVVNQRLIEMKKIKQSLKTLSVACCGGDEPATHCTILGALNTHNR